MAMRFETMTGMRKYLHDILAGKRIVEGIDLWVTTGRNPIPGDVQATIGCTCSPVRPKATYTLLFFETAHCSGDISFCNCGGSFWISSKKIDD